MLFAINYLATGTGLNRVVYIDKLMLKAKFFEQMLAQQLHPIAFSRMMTRGNIMHPAFPGQMYGLFGYFTRNIGIYALFYRLFKVTLSRSGTPCNALDGSITTTNQSGFAP